MSKFNDLHDSTLSKYAFTQRKSTKYALNIQETFEKDYQLQKQYLQKLKTQRIKTQKLFQQYTSISKDLKREKQISQKLRQEIEDLKEKNKVQMSSLKTQFQQKKMEIKVLIVEKNALIVKLKELQSQSKNLTNLKEQLQYYKNKIHELQQQLFQSTNLLKIHETEHLKQIQILRQRNLDLEKINFQTSKQIKKEIDERIKFQHQKNRHMQTLAEKTSSFEKLISNYEEELRIKDKTYQKMIGELQESNKYWTVKYEQKNKQFQYQKNYFQDQKESFKKGKDEIESMRFRLQQKQRKYDILQKDLSSCYSIIREKEQEFKKIQLNFQAIGERQSDRLKELEEENIQLKIWVEEYQQIIEHKRRRQLQHKQLLQDQLEEIKKFQRIFKNIL